MDTQPTLTLHELENKVIGGIAQAVGDRPGETPEQGAARTLAAVETIAAFEPCGVIETMLAGHCVLFHELIVDSVHHAMRDEEAAAWRATRGTIVAMDKAFGGNLASLDRRQAGRAEVVTDSGPTDALDEADIGDRAQRHRSAGSQPCTATRPAASVRTAPSQASVSAANSVSDQTSGSVRMSVPAHASMPIQTAVPNRTSGPDHTFVPVQTAVPVQTTASVQVPWLERTAPCQDEPAVGPTLGTADPVSSLNAMAAGAPREDAGPFNAVRMSGVIGDVTARSASGTQNPPYAGNRQARRHAMRHASPTKASVATAN